MVHEDRGGLPTEKQAGRGLHLFLSQITSGVYPFPGLERLCLLGVDQDGTVHLFHWLLSVLVGLNFTDGRLFDWRGELPEEVLPLVAELRRPSVK